MPEMRKDMLPDIETGEATDDVSEDEKITPKEDLEPAKEDEPAPKPPKGYVPYEAILEERNLRKEEAKKRKELEQKVTELESSLNAPSNNDDDMSDEGLFLKKELNSLKSELSSLRKEKENETVYAKYPLLQDKVEEFDEFRSDYPNVSAEKVAKLFLLENGLLDTNPKRKGLEAPTAGSKAPSPSGMSFEDIKLLREQHPRRYQRMIQQGKIKFPKDSKLFGK